MDGLYVLKHIKTIFSWFVLSFISCFPIDVEHLVQSMTLEQKIGQLIVAAAVADPEHCEGTHFLRECSYQVDQKYIEEFISKHHIGGIIFLGYSTIVKQQEYAKHLQSLSRIPLFILQDLEPGLRRIDDGPHYPRNVQLAQVPDEELYQIAVDIGRLCNTVGVHINCAPVVDVNNNPANPVIGSRSFGDDPVLVTDKAQIFMQGLHEKGVLSCIKHFPGHGDTDTDSHYELPIIPHDRKRLDTIELYPFKQLIDAGASAVMIGHLLVPVLDPHWPASLSHAIVTELLRNELGFDGLIITDALGMKALTNNYTTGEIAIAAFMAGCDILLCPLDVQEAVEALKHHIVEHDLIADLDWRVARILRMKNFFFKRPS